MKSIKGVAKNNKNKYTHLLGSVNAIDNCRQVEVPVIVAFVDVFLQSPFNILICPFILQISDTCKNIVNNSCKKFPANIQSGTKVLKRQYHLAIGLWMVST